MSKNNAAIIKDEEGEDSHLELVESKHEDLKELNSSLNELKNLDVKLQVLWKLDKLDRLTYLAELQRLDKLDHLKELKPLEHLEKLDNLTQLKQLKNLSQLKQLDKVDKLNHLMRLRYLEKLDELRALHRLGDLDKLNKLSQLDKLSYLNKLDGLKKIEKLESLNKLDELRDLLEQHSKDFERLDHLKHIAKLDNLKQLDNLDKLDNLQSLDSLVGLERLSDLSKLEKLNHLHELSSLEKLESLSSLERLSKLDQLRHLEKLENMQDLGKLDYLKDSKVQRALKGLEKLSYFQDHSKKFYLKLVSSIAVDFFKIITITGLLFFVFTKNVSRQTFDRLLPYLGFGEADRVNLALSIMSQDLSSSDFDVHYANLELRVKREVAMLFDPKTEKGLADYHLAENLTAYSFNHGKYDLGTLSKKERDIWSEKIFKKYQDSYEYDMERTSERSDLKEDISHYTRANIFLNQQKYLEAFLQFSKVNSDRNFEALGFGRSYAFYMAFLNQPKDLKNSLER